MYALGCGETADSNDAYPNCPTCKTIFYMDDQGSAVPVTCKGGGDPAFECYRVGNPINYRAVTVNGTGCDFNPPDCTLPSVPPNGPGPNDPQLYGQQTATRACAQPTG